MNKPLIQRVVWQGRIATIKGYARDPVSKELLAKVWQGSNFQLVSLKELKFV